MHKIDLDRESKFGSIVTLDIETDGFDGTENNLIAIGVGHYDGTGAPEIDVVTRANVGNDEAAVVREAFSWLNSRDTEGLVTYNGKEFDFQFLNDKLEVLGVEPKPTVPGPHLDLFPVRKRRADQANEKWPSLEECLEAYRIPLPETDWNGRPFTGKRLAEELAPQYLAALENQNEKKLNDLERIIREYTAADIEATIALYEADAGREFSPSYNF